MESLHAFNFRQWIDAQPRAAASRRSATSGCFVTATSSSWWSAAPTPARTTTSTRARSFSTSSKATWCSRPSRTGAGGRADPRRRDAAAARARAALAAASRQHRRSRDRARAPRRRARRLPVVLRELRHTCCTRSSSQLTDIETQFPPVFERFFANLQKRTCARCGTVMERAKRCNAARSPLAAAARSASISSQPGRASRSRSTSSGPQPRHFGAPAASATRRSRCRGFSGAVAQRRELQLRASSRSSRIATARTPSASGT